MSKRKIKVEFHLDTNLDSDKLKKVWHLIMEQLIIK